jgi:hypothetical protein
MVIQVNVIKRFVSYVTHKLKNECKEIVDFFSDNESYFDSDLIYIGDRNEKYEKNGYGFLLLKNGDKYLGQFQNNNIHGYGILKTQSGVIYKGYFSNNKLNGCGICEYPNVGRYEGFFVNGIASGFGGLYFLNGMSIECENSSVIYRAEKDIFGIRPDGYCLQKDENKDFIFRGFYSAGIRFHFAEPIPHFYLNITNKNKQIIQLKHKMQFIMTASIEKIHNKKVERQKKFNDKVKFVEMIVDKKIDDLQAANPYRQFCKIPHDNSILITQFLFDEHGPFKL